MKKFFIVTDKVGEVEHFFRNNYPYYKVINFNQLLKNFFNINKIFNEKNEELSKINISIEKKEKENQTEFYTEELINRKKFNLDNFFRFISKDIKFKIENLIKDYDIIIFNIDETKELKEIENKFKEVFHIKSIKFIFDKEISNNEKIKFLLTDYNISVTDKKDKTALLKTVKNYIPEIIEIKEKNIKLVSINKKYSEKELEYIKIYEEIKNTLKNEKNFDKLVTEYTNEMTKKLYSEKLDWFSEITILTVLFNKILDVKKINKNKKVLDIIVEEFELEDYQVLYYYSFNLYLLDFAIDKLLELNKNEYDKIYLDIINNNYDFYSEYQRVINKKLLNYATIYKVLSNFFDGKYKIFDTKYNILEKIYDLI